MRTHTGEKPFICEVCSANFSDPSALSNHKLQHLENKPFFTCDMCGKKFTRKRAVKIHMLAHVSRSEGDKTKTVFPHEVKKTAAELANKVGALKVASMSGIPYSTIRTWRSQFNGLEFKCQDCGKAFPSKSAKVRHTETVHNKSELEAMMTKNRGLDSSIKEEIIQYATENTFPDAASKYDVAEITVR